MPSETALTAKQERELQVALRHIGRALIALHRSGLATQDIEARAPRWRWKIERGIRLVHQASDTLISGDLERAGVRDFDDDAGEYDLIRTPVGAGPHPAHRDRA